jgi:hypothetical protein
MEKKRFDLYYTYNSDPVPFSTYDQIIYMQERVDRLSNLQKTQVILLCFEHSYNKGILKEGELNVPPFMKQVDSDTVVDFQECPEDLTLKMFKMVKVFISD